MAASDNERRGGPRDGAGRAGGGSGRTGGPSRDRSTGSGRAGGRSDDRGGYRGRDERPASGGGYRGRDERPASGGYRGNDDRPSGGYRGRDERPASGGGYRGRDEHPASGGGYRGRDERPASGGYRGNDDRPSGGYRGRDERPASGGYRGRDDRPASGGYRGRDERPASGGYRGNDDRPSGGYRGRDDRPASGGYRGRDERPASGGYRGRDERPSSGGSDRGGYVRRDDDRRGGDRGGFVRRDDDRGGYRGRDDRPSSPRRDDDRGGYRGRDDRSSAPRRDDDRGGYRGRDDRPSGPRRDDRRSGDAQQSRVWHNGRRYVGGTTSVRNSDRGTTPKPAGVRDANGHAAEGTPERPIIPDWDATEGTGSAPSLQAEGERLQKVIAAAGVASRRVAENLIAEGRVTVNGEVVDALGRRVNAETDAISVDGVPVQVDTSRRYVVLNKPTGVVSSLQDERGRRDLTEFVDRYEERLFNVGRLDTETSGLLLLTNDGDLAHVLAHPSFGVQKTYIAKVHGNVNPAVVQRLLEGVELEDGTIAADKVRLLESSRGESLIEITLHSGRNRVVRRMLEAVDHPVLELVRRSFGPLHLGSLPPGKMRELGTVEVGKLLGVARDTVKSTDQDDSDEYVDDDLDDDEETSD